MGLVAKGRSLLGEIRWVQGLAAQRSAEEASALQAADPAPDLTEPEPGRSIPEQLAGFRRGFCPLIRIRPKAGGLVPFSPEIWHPEQLAFDEQRTGHDLVLKSRQIGFSTLELARDLHRAVTRVGWNVLVVGHDRALSEQLFLAIHIMAEALKAQGLLPPTRFSNVKELVFVEMGSAVRVIEAGETERAAQKKGRSGTIQRLHATELAYWGAAYTTMTALRNAVPAGGEVVIESTANGAGGLFHDFVKQASAGRGEYKLHFYPWWRHAEYQTPVAPGFDPRPRDEWEKRLRELGCTNEQIAWWRAGVDNAAVGLDKMLEDYPVDPVSCFRAAGARYIPADVTDWLASKIRKPLRSLDMHGLEVLVYEEPVPGREYVIGADVAEGVEGDASTADVTDVKTGITVATGWSNTIQPGDHGLALAQLGTLYNRAMVGPERNNNGHATCRALDVEARYPNVYQHEDGRLGWVTNSATRPPLFDELARALREKSTWTPDAATVDECTTLIRDVDGKPRAKGKGTKGGCLDDRYVGKAISWQLRQLPQGGPRSFRIRGL